MKTIIRRIDSLNIDITFNIGQNAQDNFDLIDMSHPDDIWFHVDGKSSAHVVASLPKDHTFDKKHLHKIIVQGACVCKEFSRYASKQKVPINYAKISQLTKSADVIGSVIVCNDKTIEI